MAEEDIGTAGHMEGDKFVEMKPRPPGYGRITLIAVIVAAGLACVLFGPR